MSRQKSARVLISLPDKFLDDIDSLAADEQRSRSELIREALRFYIKNVDNGDKANSGLFE